MPFTPAHAIVAIPFVRTPFAPAAVAVGAMTPDLPLYFRFGPGYWVTHELVWILPVDVPLALVLLLVWRIILRPAVPELVPLWYARRLPRAWEEPASGWWETWGGLVASPARRLRAVVLLVAALALGSVTHLVWDAFTHEGRWASAVFPALGSLVAGRAVWEWLALTSSAIGLVLIAIWMQRWCQRQEPRVVAYRAPRSIRRAVWCALPLSLIAGGVLVAVLRPDSFDAGMGLYLERAGTAGAAILLVGLVIGAAVIRGTLARHARVSSQLAGDETST